MFRIYSTSFLLFFLFCFNTFLGFSQNSHMLNTNYTLDLQTFEFNQSHFNVEKILARKSMTREQRKAWREKYKHDNGYQEARKLVRSGVAMLTIGLLGAGAGTTVAILGSTLENIDKDLYILSGSLTAGLSGGLFLIPGMIMMLIGGKDIGEFKQDYLRYDYFF